MYKSFVRWGVSLAAAAAGVLFACTIGSPPAWLEGGGRAAVQTPEFFWAAELRRIALPLKPVEARMTGPADSGPAPYEDQVAGAHAADQARALEEKRPDAEFADYERGAEAFRRQEYDEAAKAWLSLLARPATERHYRSVWASFMLGKTALRQKQPEAVKWLQMTRTLAKEGFADSLGLAADSYGWEAKSELESGNLENAARLYLTQLALGDDSAIVSLKEVVGGQAGFPPMLAEGATEEQRQKHEEELRLREEAGLARAARDPLLRRITSAHVLATSSGPLVGFYEEKPTYSQRWLNAVEAAKLKDVEDADQLGWVAYTAGDYQAAERWLKLFSAETATSLWLKSKLLRRQGKLTESAKVMARVVRLLREDDTLNEHGIYGDRKFVLGGETDAEPLYSASGDLGSLPGARLPLLQQAAPHAASLARRLHGGAGGIREWRSSCRCCVCGGAGVDGG
jgi:hypothetical protein